MVTPRRIRTQLQSLVESTTCAEGFRCLHVDDDERCAAHDFGARQYVECIDGERASACHHALAFGYSHLCRCPVRVLLCQADSR